MWRNSAIREIDDASACPIYWFPVQIVGNSFDPFLLLGYKTIHLGIQSQSHTIG